MKESKGFSFFKSRGRLLTQILFTLLTNGYVAGFVQGKIYKGPTKMLCVPGLNCYSCPGALGACPIGALQAVLGDRSYKMSFYVVGFLFAFGAVMGRFVCGWLCPFGLVQDLLHKLPFGKKRKKLPWHKALVWLKYVILVGFVILLPLFVVDMTGIGKPWFCEYICPSGTLLAGIPLVLANTGLRAAAGWLFAWKSALLAGLVVLSVFVYRPFCQYLCPLGAIYGWFNPIALFRYTLSKQSCTQCGLCQKACPVDIKTWETPNSTECIRCGQCKAACPHGALADTFHLPKPTAAQ